MKKLLRLLATVAFVALLSGGYLVVDRWRKNPEQIVPYPYDFQAPSPAMKPDAPILIVGDRMGEYFGRFKEELAAAISQNLDNVIKTQSIAAEGLGLHRTLHQLRSLSQWPQIVIYQGGSEEFAEEKFLPSETRKIAANFRLYQDDRIHTFLILYPWLSRLVYAPMERAHLGAVPKIDRELSEKEYLQRLQTELLLYEEQLGDLVSMARDRNSLLILTTTPINLDVAPKKVCSFASNTEIDKALEDLRKKSGAGDWKGAWKEASRLSLLYSGNAELYYLKGMIGKNLSKGQEAVNSMLEASSYDCAAWRATELQNSIIRKVARAQKVILFDFSRMVEKDWINSTTFLDELRPQNIYYDKAMNQLGSAIRKILKL